MRVYFDNNFPIELTIEELSLSTNKNDIKTAFDNISNILRNLDIDIEKMEYNGTFITNECENKSLINNELLEDMTDEIPTHKDKILTYHKNINGDLIEFGFGEESLGTKEIIPYNWYLFKNSKRWSCISCRCNWNNPYIHYF